MPAQVTWRADEALIARIRIHAAHHALSMNEFITQVMRTVTDPTFAASLSEQVRERLRAADLLAEWPACATDDSGDSGENDHTIDWDEVEAAGQEAARGTSLSQLIAQDR